MHRGAIALLGIPLDHNSSHLHGCAEAPARIRAALFGGSANTTAENGIDIADAELLIDVGDVAIVDDARSFDAIDEAVAAQLAMGRRVVSLGGDHSVTFPIVTAHARVHPRLKILHFDAHPDLYDDFDSNPFSHASPFARIMEQGLAEELTQIGIRTLNRHQSEQARRFGVKLHPMRDFDRATIPLPDGPTYVTIDLDALDPAFAPGVSHHEPGGLSVRDVLSLIQRLPGPIIGADIVELNPRRDVNDMTAMVAAKLLKEIVGHMA